jgi:hypothetical protein
MRSSMPSPSSRLRRGVVTIAVFSVVPMLAACPKKDPPAVFDAAPPPPPPVEDAAPLMLLPVEEDAGVDAGVDAGKKYTGTGVSTNVARLRQCCNQLANEAKRMGSSPEAGLFTQAAAQCSALAGQIGPSGNAPEMGALRTLLAGRTVPPVCSGF